MTEKRYLRPDEVARDLEEPVRNIYLWIQKGLIEAVHLGKKIKISREELERIRKEGTKPKVTLGG
jgi:excisionase family DNA binding protein